jgi:phosphoribosylformylglycinamidine cyclo-ligase
VSDRYAAAGVSFAAADEAKRRIVELVAGTRTPLTLGQPGAFGGMVRVPPDVERPVLVMSTDGVGTKVLVAARAGVHDTVGEDLVNHCVNDILVHGARPVAFLDYVATSRLSPTSRRRWWRAWPAVPCPRETLAGGETAGCPTCTSPDTTTSPAPSWASWTSGAPCTATASWRVTH